MRTSKHAKGARGRESTRAAFWVRQRLRTYLTLFSFRVSSRIRLVGLSLVVLREGFDLRHGKSSEHSFQELRSRQSRPLDRASSASRLVGMNDVIAPIGWKIVARLTLITPIGIV